MKKTRKKQSVAVMRMLRWSAGKTRRDRIRNNIKREVTVAIEVSSEIEERRLRRFGRVMRSEERQVSKRVCRTQVEGKEGGWTRTVSWTGKDGTEENYEKTKYHGYLLLRAGHRLPEVSNSLPKVPPTT